MKKRIAFFDSKPYDIESFNQVKPEDMEFKFFETKLNEDTAGLAAGYDAVCAFVNDTINSTVIKKLSSMDIRLISMRCAGYNNADLKAAWNNVHITRVPAYSPYAVAEHALSLIMTLNRKTHRAYYRTRDNNFNISGFVGFDMHGKTAGIIGTGKIGRILIKILKGLGMEVLAYDAYPNEEAARQDGFSYTDLDSLLKKSDIISLHCPLNAETHHIIDREALDKTKDNVMIINSGRGGLIDSKALLQALKDGSIGAAGLDVYEEESEFFFEDFSEEGIKDDILSRFLSFPNVLVTSHQAFLTREALNNIALTTISNLSDFFQNKSLENEVCYKCDKTDCRKEKKGRCF